MPPLATGTADRPRASRQVIQDPQDFQRGPETIGYLHPSEAPRDSDTQGIGKSPGMRWPWMQFFQSLRLVSLSRNYRGHWNHELPSRLLIAGERGPLDRHYLDYYEQAPRHAWPGGGVIEYPATMPLTNIARRIG